MNLSLVRKWFGRYKSLEQRERVALLSLAGFFVVLIFYFAIWSPIAGYYQSGETSRDQQLELLQYMKVNEAKARAAASSSGGSSGPVNGGSLLTTLSRSAQQIGIKPSRLQPEGSDAVNVWFDSVPFSQLIKLLELTETRQSITVQQISIDRTQSPGRVKARIVLQGS